MTTECNHNCQRKCPCPEACELPVQFAEPEPTSFSFIKWALVVFTAVAAVSFLARYF